MEITIKPHHFMDIIKLYGSGIEAFVPDEKMGHDFYRVANRIIENRDVILNLTVDADEICAPCKMCREHKCVDKLENIPNFTSKDTYNRALDGRLMEKLGLDAGEKYKAGYLCSVMLENHEVIYSVWREEEETVTQRRHELFVEGGKKYLAR